MNNTRAMQAHLEQLCKDLGVKLVQKYDLPGMMFVEEDPPRIESPLLVPCDIVPNVRVGYMAGVHEVGHVEHGHTQGRPPYDDQTFYFDNGVLRSEAEAWEFALDNHIAELTARDSSYMADHLFGSYIMSAKRMNGKPLRLPNGNRHYVEFTFDDPNDPYVQSILHRLNNAHKEG